MVVGGVGIEVSRIVDGSPTEGRLVVVAKPTTLGVASGRAWWSIRYAWMSWQEIWEAYTAIDSSAAYAS